MVLLSWYAGRSFLTSRNMRIESQCLSGLWRCCWCQWRWGWNSLHPNHWLWLRLHRLITKHIQTIALLATVWRPRRWLIFRSCSLVLKQGCYIENSLANSKKDPNDLIFWGFPWQKLQILSFFLPKTKRHQTKTHSTSLDHPKNANSSTCPHSHRVHHNALWG